MAESKDELHAKKCEHLVRDWEAAWEVRRLLDRWLHVLRGGSITVALAYVGFVGTSDRNWTTVSLCLVWLASVLLLLWFYGFDVLIRTQAYFYRDHIRRIDDLFSTSNHDDFVQGVKGHSFLSQRESGSDGRADAKARDRWPRFWKALKNPWAWAWYAPLMLLTLLVTLAVWWPTAGGPDK